MLVGSMFAILALALDAEGLDDCVWMSSGLTPVFSETLLGISKSAPKVKTKHRKKDTNNIK